MVADRSQALLELTDTAIADASRVEQLGKALSFWPVFRQDVWNRLLNKVEPILTNTERDCGDQKSLVTCIEAILRLCSPSDRFVGLVADLPRDVLFNLVALMSTNCRSMLVRILASSRPEMADEIALSFDTELCSTEMGTESECESLQLPYSSHWVAALLHQPTAVIQQALHYLSQQCCDDVFWEAAIDQLVSCCDPSLLNQLCIWDVAGIRRIVSERKLLRSPSITVLVSLGLAENDSIGNCSRLFSRARRKSSDFLVQPERFALELESFLRFQDPAANHLELAAAVFASLVKYPNVQLRKQIVGTLLSHAPSRFNLEALQKVCSESVPSEINASSAIVLVGDMIARRGLRKHCSDFNSPSDPT